MTAAGGRGGKATVRRERPADAAAIRRVQQAAFARPHEAALVDALREAGAAAVSLVGEVDGALVAHVLFSTVTIGGADGVGLGLGPVAVLPDSQRQGLGSALIRRGFEECARLDRRVVVVLGAPQYYRRFGFQSAAGHGLRCEFPAPEEAFMVLELEAGALGRLRGVVRYRPEFARV